jgi:hypothetical protein
MSTRKRQKRQQATAEEHSIELQKVKELDALAAVQDTDLFVVDRGGSKTAKRKIEKQVQQAATVSVSKTERALVRKVVSRKAAEEEEEQTPIGDIWGMSGSKTVARGKGKLQAKDKMDAKKPGAAPVVVKNKRLVVRPGQSYNPAPKDHQDLLAEALALELKKKEKDARSAGKEELLFIPAPLETDLAKFGDGDSEDDDSDDNEEGEDGMPLGNRRSRRKGSKLTVAQRNKMRTRKTKSFQELKQKQEKELLKGIDNSAKYLKQMDDEDGRVERRRQMVELQKAASAGAKLNYDEAKAVPLSDELRGSLRQITAKGLLIGDKVKEMRENGENVSKRDRKRKHWETPHGSSKICWVPKYKYV